jgi:hypothetical protein
MASKPIPAVKPGETLPRTPRVTEAPASPARPPEKAITRTVAAVTLMPA